MAVYAISDLHLALSIHKPMDIFGPRWEDYMEKLKMFWEETVANDDYVIIAGDVSWATYLKEAYEDFKFINSLPGNKIITKGNHDYWWTTQKKLCEFLDENDFNTIKFLQNSSIKVEDIIICGTRGWNCPGDEEFGPQDRKIYERELNRLKLSLASIKKEDNEKIMVVLHFPPFNSKGEPSDFIDIMKKNNVEICVYGHLHGASCLKAVEGTIEGISYSLISADYLGFKPIEISR
ncbi:MAG TPA: serine/threonine protein phosphatase [Clostridiaceae bacterium]|nr:serine/threonine protein phosphatase [Clostridiaceae bacterium]